MAEVPVPAPAQQARIAEETPVQEKIQIQPVNHLRVVAQAITKRIEIKVRKAVEGNSALSPKAKQIQESCTIAEHVSQNQDPTKIISTIPPEGVEDTNPTNRIYTVTSSTNDNYVVSWTENDKTKTGTISKKAFIQKTYKDLKDTIGVDTINREELAKELGIPVEALDFMYAYADSQLPQENTGNETQTASPETKKVDPEIVSKTAEKLGFITSHSLREVVAVFGNEKVAQLASELNKSEYQTPFLSAQQVSLLLNTLQINYGNSTLSQLLLSPQAKSDPLLQQRINQINDTLATLSGGKDGWTLGSIYNTIAQDIASGKTPEIPFEDVIKTINDLNSDPEKKNKIQELTDNGILSGFAGLIGVFALMYQFLPKKIDGGNAQ